MVTYAVAPGTKFLVRLEEELGTRGTQENAKFKVKTLEPLEAGSGIYLPSGAEIRGHSHVEPAGVAGRAKKFLTVLAVGQKIFRVAAFSEGGVGTGGHDSETAATAHSTDEGPRHRAPGVL